ncbi:hypothetical protein [Ruminococcus albus]|uniref:Internalin A n=1 Tax=Ruminococcus albus (strain ATCC 27210 / DSM 20455 / JCM 14654 / NCDO 2250 / 7) TaxID=697329 RepID=E6UEH1_RUMA7|nr:hypothetical protein [Ruminococcus albus]ADU20926.1 hypothetical protein Rumal_0371 [Ruminococcus albus 7 = DSM 20455]
MENLSTLSVYGLDKLQEINIAHTDFTDFEGLLELPNLKEVDVSDSMMSEEMMQRFKDKGITVTILD